MSVRHSSAVLIAPLFLRLALAVTFLWAGFGKLLGPFEVGPQDAAILANLQVLTPPAAPTPPPPTPPPSALAAPDAAIILTSYRPAQDTTTPPPPKPAPTATPAPTPTPAPTSPTPSTPTPSSATPSAPAATPSAATTPAPSTPAAPTTPRLYTAADFPEKTSTSRVHSITLRVYKAAFPLANAEGLTPKPIWPRALATGTRPVILAWAAAITECLAGILLLVGLMTRLAALSVLGVMLTAMWLTVLGPASQSSNAVLGFLPNNNPWDVSAWTVPLWQFALICASAALAFAGPGTLSFDSLLTRPKPTPAPQ
jgi:uncharacterized membrane protein YphA (DoxX/SURF4 family)